MGYISGNPANAFYKSVHHHLKTSNRVHLARNQRKLETANILNKANTEMKNST